MSTKIKICGLKSIDDIFMVNELKPDFCGFIINFPKSHRSRSPEEVTELVRNLNRDTVIPVGVFVNEDVSIVARLINDGVIAMAQLHGNEDEEYIQRLRGLIDNSEGYDGKIIKAFQIKTSEDILKAVKSSADFVLLDQGQGCGETFDWSLINAEDIKRDWFLAGGINDNNVRNAIERFAPFAVDLSSAVETDNKKDFEKVKKIIDIVRK